MWTTRQGSAVVRIECPDGQAVHLEGSGMTHLVDKVSGEVLFLLSTGARTLAEVRRLIVEHAGSDEVTEAMVEEQWLRPLEAIGLVEEIG